MSLSILRARPRLRARRERGGEEIESAVGEWMDGCGRVGSAGERRREGGDSERERERGVGWAGEEGAERGRQERRGGEGDGRL